MSFGSDPEPGGGIRDLYDRCGSAHQGIGGEIRWNYCFGSFFNSHESFRKQYDHIPVPHSTLKDEPSHGGWALGLGIRLGLGLMGHAATLAGLGDVFNGSNLDRLPGRVGLSHLATGGSAARRCRCRTCGAGNLDLVADVLAQLGCIAGQLKAFTVAVSQCVVPVGAAQTALNGRFTTCT